MRTSTNWLALLLTVGVALAPTGVRSQEVPQADPVIPLPLYHDRPEKGGFYTFGEFLFMRQTNPIKDQIIAVRGLLDFDGSITAELNGTTFVPTTGNVVIQPGTPTVGAFIGSGAQALNAKDVSGPGSYQPGFKLGLGWRFKDGTTVSFDWMRLTEAKYNAVATLVPPRAGFGATTPSPGQILEETFLYSPVFGFPNEFAGAPFKLALGNPFAAYGIWDAASIMSLTFVQRFSQYDITVRTPIYDGECCRMYGLTGPRYINMWERFGWRTVSESFDGTSDEKFVALYSNVVSNQMYGVDVGLGNEWYIAKGFALSVDGRAAGLVDFITQIQKYERADHAIGNKRAKHEYQLVPELEVAANVWWYPIEGVQIRVGYEFMNFFNTSSVGGDPVSFSYGGLDATYKRTYRFFDGLNAGIAFIF